MELLKFSTFEKFIKSIEFENAHQCTVLLEWTQKPWSKIHVTYSLEFNSELDDQSGLQVRIDIYQPCHPPFHWGDFEVTPSVASTLNQLMRWNADNDRQKYTKEHMRYREYLQDFK